MTVILSAIRATNGVLRQACVVGQQIPLQAFYLYVQEKLT